jgi:hypothetical protein
MMEGEGGRGSSVCVMLRYINIYLTNLLVGVGIPSSERSGSSALQGKLGARRISLDSVWPLCQLRGLRGKKSTPRIGWEVPVKSRWSASGSCMERARRQSEQAIRKWYTLHFCMVECVRTYAWICVFSGEVN